MAELNTLASQVETLLSDFEITKTIAHDELTIEVEAKHIKNICEKLRDDKNTKFEELMDLCGVDYAEYGLVEWETEIKTETGFSRGVEKLKPSHITKWDKPRFAVVYHLLSITHNHRLRIRTFPKGELPRLDSVIDVWNVANWFEREAYDLFGIIFDGHNDLRRILTDYGFIGHPFRKDFPLIGTVEPRYDATEERVIYEPVSITPRTLVPKVIRDDSRYEDLKQQAKEGDKHD